MRKPKISRELLLLAILTLITVLTWISFEIYRTFTQPVSLKIPTTQLEPLDPKINMQIMENLAKRETISKEELNLPLTTLPSTPSGQTEQP